MDIGPFTHFEKRTENEIRKPEALMKVSEDMSHLNKKILNFHTTSYDSKWYRSWWAGREFFIK